MTISMPAVWTVQQVAEYLAVQPSLVQQEFECGKIKGFKVGEEWRCIQSDVLDYIRAQRLKAESSAGGNKNRSEPTTSGFTRVEP
ncbi:MAG: helix-turn-helix domain-containing protein, partial [Dehalococcoidia bacterium]|nr:helix-turn-helix domain-containing protein [Dehalococcoidia bacterium]